MDGKTYLTTYMHSEGKVREKRQRQRQEKKTLFEQIQEISPVIQRNGCE